MKRLDGAPARCTKPYFLNATSTRHDQKSIEKLLQTSMARLPKDVLRC